MEINLPGIACFFLTIMAIVTVAYTHNQMAAFLGTMAHIGPGNSTEDKAFGVLAFSLVILLIVAVVKILVSRSRGG